MSTQTRYDVRSEGGAITAPGAEDRQTAQHRAAELAAANPGQRIWLFRDGRPVRSGGAWLTWTSGPSAEVQR